MGNSLANTSRNLRHQISDQSTTKEKYVHKMNTMLVLHVIGEHHTHKHKMYLDNIGLLCFHIHHMHHTAFNIDNFKLFQILAMTRMQWCLYRTVKKEIHKNPVSIRLLSLHFVISLTSTGMNQGSQSYYSIETLCGWMH